MGGSVSLTIREPDGAEHRLCVWTNALPGFIDNMKLVNKDMQHVREYVAHYSDSSKRPYGSGILAPDGYGLVVVDMQKNVILSNQDYTTLGQMYSFSVVNDLNGCMRCDPGCGPVETLTAFYKAGRVTAESLDRKPMTLPPFDELMKKIGDRNTSPIDNSFFFNLDMSPYTVVNYSLQRFKSDWLDFRQRLVDLGFQFSAEEKKQWTDWIERAEDDECDGDDSGDESDEDSE